MTDKCAAAVVKPSPTISKLEIADETSNQERPIGKYERLRKGLAAIPEPLGRHADDLFPEETEVPRSKKFQDIDSEDEFTDEKENKGYSNASNASTSCGNSEVDDSEFDESDEEDAENETWRSVIEIAKEWKLECERARKRSTSPQSQRDWGESANIARSVTKDEMMSQKTAIVAKDKEWNKLWEQEVFDATCCKS